MTHKEMCIKIWEYLAANGGNFKHIAVETLFDKNFADYLIKLHHGCPACLYASIKARKTNKKIKCQVCPVTWGKYHFMNCESNGTNYSKWCRTGIDDKMTRIEQARKVLFLIRTTWKEETNAQDE